MKQKHALAHRPAAKRPEAGDAAPGAGASHLALAAQPDIGNLSLQALLAGGLRPKLEIGGADDPEERAADRVADAILGGGRSPCACGSTCSKCAGGGAGPLIRRKAEGGAASPATVSQAFRGSGRNMDLATRARFERPLGADLSAVRVHNDDHSASVARSIGARAYTVGHNIGFARGAFNPETGDGQRLIAHELAHVALGHGGVRRDGEQHNSAPTEDGPAKPSSDWFYFRQIPVADDAEFMRGTLRHVIGEKGISGADEWVLQLNECQGRPCGGMPLPFSAHARAFGGLRVRSPLDAQHDMRDEERRSSLAPTAIPTTLAVYREVRAEARAFLVTFEANAISITNDILSASEAKAEAERLRYGLNRTEKETTRWRRDGEGGSVPVYDVKVSHSMEDQLPGQSLAGAAKDLLEKRNEISNLAVEQGKIGNTTCSPGGCFTNFTPEERLQREGLARKITEKRNELDVLKGGYQERYPILGRLADDISSLRTLSRGPSSAAAEVLNDQVLGTLANIREVRSELYPGGKANIWRLADIVRLAKAASGAGDGNAIAHMKTGAVDEKVRQIQDDEAWHERLMSALVIGLSIVAAIPSGGSSLVVGATALAGIGAFTLGAIAAVDHIDDYLFEKAMAGTDFDRAKAIAATDPSLFWLAVEIVGVMADLGPAVRGAKTMLTAGKSAFTSLSSATRHYVAAKGVDSVSALAELRAAADAAEGSSGLKGLSSRVLASAELVVQKGGSAEIALGKAAGHEAKAVANGIAELEKGVGYALGKSSTRLGGHTVSVMPNGWLVRCSICGTLRSEFAIELGSDPTLARRMFDLESKSAKAVAAGDRAIAQSVAEEARVFADELQAMRSANSLTVLGHDGASALIAKHPQLTGELAIARSLEGDAAEMAMRDMLTRADLLERAGSMTLPEIEKLLDSARFAVGTAPGKDLRFLRYTKEGGVLPFDRWEKMAGTAWENASLGSRTEKELASAYDLGMKNTKTMHAPKGDVDFIPDHVAGNPEKLKWGESYDFVEIKDWASMSQTGNVKAMLEYVEQTNSTLTLYFRSTTKMSGPLMGRIEALRRIGKVKLLPYAGR